jgi:hypothetical protein
MTVIRRNLAIKLALAGLAIAAGVLLTMNGSQVAEANSCVASCRAAHSQCRIATKGSPSCDAQLQSCLSGCLTKR